jgi:hypothetical protein
LRERVEGSVEKRGSAIWGGATLGLFIGLVLGFFVGSYWTTVLYSVLIGAGSGVVANLIAWPGDVIRRRELMRREHRRRDWFEMEENSLREHGAADFATTPNAERDAINAVWSIENEERWRTRYESLEAFYASHEDEHPEIRSYAARLRKELLDSTEEALRANSPADFDADPDAAFTCVGAAGAVVDWELWRAGYDSLESFYREHEARHPDVRVYAAVYNDGDPERYPAEIAKRR